MNFPQFLGCFNPRILVLFTNSVVLFLCVRKMLSELIFSRRRKQIHKCHGDPCLDSDTHSLKARRYTVEGLYEVSIHLV